MSVLNHTTINPSSLEGGRSLVLLFLFCISVTANSGGNRADMEVREKLIDKGRNVYKTKGNCAYCHGWAADGAGSPRSPGDAPGLRSIPYSQEVIIDIIQCGRPGTEMPFHDRMAYKDGRCYGMKSSDIGQGQLPPPGNFLSRNDLMAVAAYIALEIKGSGVVTRRECKKYWGEKSRHCARYPE